MGLESVSLIKSRLKKQLADKDVIDIIVFGSFAKGKAAPKDIDIAVITHKDVGINIPGFHVSVLNPLDFFKQPPLLVNTLLREGYSLRNNKPVAELYRFSAKVLFSYELSGLSPSLKVMTVNLLRGKDGMVEKEGGEWLANGVFLLPTAKDSMFERFFISKGVKYRKHYVLIH